jgi:hypothetical protein
MTNYLSHLWSRLRLSAGKKLYATTGESADLAVSPSGCLADHRCSTSSRIGGHRSTWNSRRHRRLTLLQRMFLLSVHYWTYRRNSYVIYPLALLETKYCIDPQSSQPPYEPPSEICKKAAGRSPMTYVCQPNGQYIFDSALATSAASDGVHFAPSRPIATKPSLFPLEKPSKLLQRAHIAKKSHEAA